MSTQPGRPLGENHGTTLSTRDISRNKSASPEKTDDFENIPPNRESESSAEMKAPKNREKSRTPSTLPTEASADWEAVDNSSTKNAPEDDDVVASKDAPSEARARLFHNSARRLDRTSSADDELSLTPLPPSPVDIKPAISRGIVDGKSKQEDLINVGNLRINAYNFQKPPNRKPVKVGKKAVAARPFIEIDLNEKPKREEPEEPEAVAGDDDDNLDRGLNPEQQALHDDAMKELDASGNAVGTESEALDSSGTEGSDLSDWEDLAKEFAVGEKEFMKKFPVRYNLKLKDGLDATGVPIYTIGEIASINGFLLGKPRRYPYDQQYVNAAWGCVVKLMDILYDKFGVKYEEYTLVPNGTRSFIDRRTGGLTGLPLYLPRHPDPLTISLFNDAQSAFLTCMKDLEEKLKLSRPDFNLPYKIRRNNSLQHGISKSIFCIWILDESRIEWTRALRLMVANLKYIRSLYTKEILDKEREMADKFGDIVLSNKY